jgi:hypothetical protein
MFHIYYSHLIFESSYLHHPNSKSHDSTTTKSSKFKLYLFLPFIPLFGAYLNSSLFAFLFHIFKLSANHSSNRRRSSSSSSETRIFAYVLMYHDT